MVQQNTNNGNPPSALNTQAHACKRERERKEFEIKRYLRDINKRNACATYEFYM